MRELSDKLKLYWRILKEERELEVVLVNKGVSYVALGWRPANATSACREFPKIEGPPPPKFISKEPKAPTAKLEQSPVREQPQPKPDPQPEATSEANREVVFPEGFFFTRAEPPATSTEAATQAQGEGQTISLAGNGRF